MQVRIGCSAEAISKDVRANNLKTWSEQALRHSGRTFAEVRHCSLFCSDSRRLGACKGGEITKCRSVIGHLPHERWWILGGNTRQNTDNVLLHQRLIQLDSSRVERSYMGNVRLDVTENDSQNCSEDPETLCKMHKVLAQLKSELPVHGHLCGLYESHIV